MNVLYYKTTFWVSAPDLDCAPADTGFEVAFCGRSNAGKSSAINAITHQKSLARTSKTPGRTRQLVFFKVDDQRRIVDLPGYGYAKVPAAMQRQWHQAMESYFVHRQSLRGIFLFMDIRHPMTDFDRQMIRWCAACELSLHIALTKADKVKRGAARNTLLRIKASLVKNAMPVTAQLFSATQKVGIDQAHDVLDQWLEVN